MMRSIAVVGAGQSGGQLALGLLRHGYQVTLVSDRTPEEVRSGPVMSSQCMFDSALQTERELGLNQWEELAPKIDGISYRVLGSDGAALMSWTGDLDHYAQSVDQRVKCAAWIEQFIASGGTFINATADVEQLESLADTHDLVVVSSGKGELGSLFARDAAKSPFDAPQRALALTYVTGMTPSDEGSPVRFNVAPGIGEYFVFGALTTTGVCDIMVFEGVPGGPMDCWDDVTTPQEHLACSLAILREHFPHEYARCANVLLTDDGGVLRGRFAPTVRKPVGALPSGAAVLGMGDAVILNDPITGQGSNNAAKFADFYLQSILDRGEHAFDEIWMRATFDRYWRGWSQWVVGWTNSLLTTPPNAAESLMAAAGQVPSLARALANGFDDPRAYYPWWFDSREASSFIEAMRREDAAVFDARDLRSAFSQYATGITVVTAQGSDAPIGMTANSFTSVSMDPPLVLWCPGKNSPSTAQFKAASHFAINVLARDQHDLSRQFATPADDKFAGVEIELGRGNVPLIKGALARFQCRTVNTYDAGDHLIMVGEIEAYDASDGEPLVFHSGRYHVATLHPDT